MDTDYDDEDDDDLEEGEVPRVMMRTAGVQTGGPKEAGRKLVTTKRVQKLGDLRHVCG